MRKQTYIKRVIGLPGETVEIRDGKIYIDGSSEPLEEDYLKEHGPGKMTVIRLKYQRDVILYWVITETIRKTVVFGHRSR